MKSIIVAIYCRSIYTAKYQPVSVLEAAGPEIVIGTSVSQIGGGSDGRPSTALRNDTISDDAEGNRTRLSIKRLTPVVDSCYAGVANRSAGSDLHFDRRSRHQESAEEDAIFDDTVCIDLGLTIIWIITNNTAFGTTSGRG